ncbi:MAG: formyl transferase [Siculibacillus sp.]|nr:formyl transferase [Siculibacillus sp.]
MNRRSMTIEIRVDPADLRRWHRRVVEVLAATAGITVHLTPTPRRLPAAAGLDLLFTLERLTHRGLAETAADRLDGDTFTRFVGPERPVDLVVDLGCDGDVPSRGAHLAVDCGGLPPLDGAVAAILAGETPVLTARLRVDGRARTLARWSLAIEDHRSALRSASMALGRAAHLVLASVEALRATDDAEAVSLHLAEGEGTAPPVSMIAATGFVVRTLSARIADRLTRLSNGAPTWATAWRRRDAATPSDRFELDPTPFRFLPDDGRRFYADPFLLADAGRLHLFCEEFPFATGKGVISVATLGENGTFGPVRPVLELDCHLSYPHVFAHAGRVWMVPETSGRRTVELWVSDRLPDRWSPHSVLLDDVDLADATLAEIDGTWWLFGASREPWTSSWEALSIWSAPAPTGPWTPHPGNPTIVDARAARPAGAAFRTAEGWFRPVQDCGRGYGAGLAVARLAELDAHGHRETVIRRIAAPPLTGLHTWNRAAAGDATFEVIDLHGPRAALVGARRLDLAVTDVRTPPAEHG